MGEPQSDQAEIFQTQTTTHIQAQPIDLTKDMSSEGYRSSESREGRPENRKNKSEKNAEKKPKIRTRTRSYERPRRNIDDFLQTVIPTSSGVSSLSSNLSRSTSKESSVGSCDQSRLEVVETPFELQPDKRSPRKNSLYSTESESLSENKVCQKIIRVKVTRTSDNKYTYGFLTDDGVEEKITPLKELSSNRRNFTDAERSDSDKNSFRSEKLAPKLRRTKLPERRDTFTRKFEQSQKEAKNGMEKVFTRGSQRASQLLIDLQISMASNGYGK